MKKIILQLRERKLLLPSIFLSICFIVVIVSGIFFFLLSGDKETSNLSFTLISESGDVSFKSEETATYSKMDEDEIELNSGSYIKTGKDSYAHILMPDNSVITIDALTEITVSVGDEGVNVREFLGNTWHRVHELDKGDIYEVKTSTTTASVRGTIFSVNVDAQKNTLVIVNEDSVDVTECEGKDKFHIEEGNLALIVNDNKNCELNKAEIFSEIEKSNWFLKNSELDKFFLDTREDNLDQKEFKKDLIAQIKSISEEYSAESSAFPKEIKIDLTLPELTITEPEDASFETNEKNLKIEGKVTEDSVLRVNEKEVIYSGTKFEYSIELKEGENVIKITAENPFTKNKATEEITVTYDPNSSSSSSKKGSSSSTVGANTINLTGSKTTSGVLLNWTITGSEPQQGYYLMISDSPGVSYTNADVISLSSSEQNYTYEIYDGNTHYFAVCVAAEGGCAVISNEVSIKAPARFQLSVLGSMPNTVKWQVNGPLSSEGYKVVFSKTQNPNFLNSNYNSEINPATFQSTISALEGPGLYYVRVCEFVAGTCINYSNEVSLNVSN